MLKFKVVYSTKISLTFSAIKKNNKKKSFVHPEDNYVSNKWEKFQTDRSSRSQVTVITDFENMVSRKTRLKFYGLLLWIRDGSI